VVWKAINKLDREIVAIKKIYDAFANPIDAKRSWREAFFLNELKHPNILRIFRTRKAKNDRDLYLVTEYVENDLHSVIRANICEEIQNKYIIFCILRALKVRTS
jgi:mitogen-activated protein kinase 15